MSRSIRAFGFVCIATASATAASFSYAAPAAPVPMSTTDDAATMSDANILAMLMAVNDTEIGAANAAITDKMVTGDVKGYAEMMLKHHTANNADTKRLADKLNITPDESEACKAMKMKDAEQLKEMKALDKDAFEKAYIQMMVDGHTAVLGKLDLAISSTSNDDVKKHLEATKKVVQKHLDEAKEIQADWAKK